VISNSFGSPGAIYFWVRLPSAGKPPLGDDHAVVRYLAEKFLVKLLPGSAFGAPKYVLQLKLLFCPEAFCL
jgi:aspartate/methionine/tyrosine aminotransferase